MVGLWAVDTLSRVSLPLFFDFQIGFLQGSTSPTAVLWCSVSATFTGSAEHLCRKVIHMTHDRHYLKYNHRNPERLRWERVLNYNSMIIENEL